MWCMSKLQADLCITPTAALGSHSQSILSYLMNVQYTLLDLVNPIRQLTPTPGARGNWNQVEQSSLSKLVSS